MQFANQSKQKEYHMDTKENTLKPLTPEEYDAAERAIYEDMISGKWGPEATPNPAAPAQETALGQLPPGGQI
jgi:hypothetical protein